MKYVVVDIEADGPIPGKYSMLSLGAVMLDATSLDTLGTLYTEFKPISDEYVPDALRVSGFTREQTLSFLPAKEGMQFFKEWLTEIANGDRAQMVADNAGFDWSFVNWYFHNFLGANPLGFSCLSLTSLYKGVKMDMRASFKHLRRTRHTHNALDDARGNAEALVTILKDFR